MGNEIQITTEFNGNFEFHPLLFFLGIFIAIVYIVTLITLKSSALNITILKFQHFVLIFNKISHFQCLKFK